MDCTDGTCELCQFEILLDYIDQHGIDARTMYYMKKVMQGITVHWNPGDPVPGSIAACEAEMRAEGLEPGPEDKLTKLLKIQEAKKEEDWPTWIEEFHKNGRLVLN